MIINVSELEKLLARSPKKYLIFDFDYTLFKLHLPWEIYLSQFAKIMQEYDVDLYAELIKSGLQNSEIVNHYTAEFGPEVRQKIADFSYEFEKDNLSGVSENKELVQWVRDHADQYTFFIWTSNDSRTVGPILEENQLTDLVKVLVAQDDVKLVKPDPDGFERIIWPSITVEDEGAKKSDCLMIGDSLADQEAAKAAGIDFQKIQYFTKLSWTDYKKLIDKLETS